MENKFMRVEEVAAELGVSASYAYKVIRRLNDELKAKGFVTIAGRINRQYLTKGSTDPDRRDVTMPVYKNEDNGTWYMEGVFNCHQLPDMNSASRPAGISQDSCNAAPGSLDIPGIIIYNQEALLSGIMFSEIKVNGFSEPPVLSAAAYGLRAGAGYSRSKAGAGNRPTLRV